MNKLIPIYIVVKESFEVTRVADESIDVWDNDDISYIRAICGFRLNKTKCHWPYYEFNVKPPVKDKYYFVYVTYNTGDSFHREDNRMVEVGLFDNVEDAKFVVELISRDANNLNSKKESNTIKTILPSKKKFEIYTGAWKGYFEVFNYAEYEVVREIK